MRSLEVQLEAPSDAVAKASDAMQHIHSGHRGVGIGKKEVCKHRRMRRREVPCRRQPKATKCDWLEFQQGPYPHRCRARLTGARG